MAMNLKLVDEAPKYGLATMVYTHWTQKAITELAEVLNDGEKVTDAMVSASVTLQNGAVDYARNYIGNFSFMMELSAKANTKKGLSIPQMLGALNCLVAEAKRTVAKEITVAKAVEEAAALPEGANEYMGIAGQKVAFRGTITRMSVKSGQYGETTIVKMVAESGQGAVWFASGDKTDVLTENTVVWVDGTIKGQNEWQGRKETILTRCKVKAVELAIA